METPGDQYRIESELPSSPKLVLQFLRYTKIADNPTQPIPTLHNPLCHSLRLCISDYNSSVTEHALCVVERGSRHEYRTNMRDRW